MRQEAGSSTVNISACQKNIQRRRGRSSSPLAAAYPQRAGMVQNAFQARKQCQQVCHIVMDIAVSRETGCLPPIRPARTARRAFALIIANVLSQREGSLQRMQTQIKILNASTAASTLMITSAPTATGRREPRYLLQT